MLYLPDETEVLISYMSSVFRQRKRVRCVCLANAIKWTNPYFSKYKFKPIDVGYQKTNKNDVLLYVYQNAEYTADMEDSWLANVSSGSAYGDMMVHNRFVDVNDNFICRKTPDAYLVFNIKWKGITLGLWNSHSQSRYVVSKAYNSDVKTMCYTASDMTPNLLLLNQSTHPLNKLLKQAFSKGYLYYEDLYIRDIIYDIINSMGIRR